MVSTGFPGLPPSTDPNLLEFCKNLLFATHHKQCDTASELLQKVVALKCIQDNIMISAQNISNMPSPAELIAKFATSSPDAPEQQHSDTPVFFNSLTAVLHNLQKNGVDAIVAESIALDRLCSPQANPLSFMSRMILNGVEVSPMDEITSCFVKSVMKRLHDHEKFTTDGAPYPFDIKSALRYSEHLHSQIPLLESINPPHIAHEQSITFTAMGRFMAMHEINVDLRLLFPVESNVLEDHAYYSAMFWTYREAFKSFYYPKMPAPLPPTFQLTPAERQILTRYWNSGNRHVTASESMLLARRCPSLAPYQVYGYFDKRRRKAINKYRGLRDEETLALETTHCWKKLRELKQTCDDEDSDDEDDMMIQREFLTKPETTKLDLLWQFGHRKPSRNECELMAADFQIESSEQIFAYFEDRRWHEEYQNRKKSSTSKSSRRK